MWQKPKINLNLSQIKEKTSEKIVEVALKTRQQTQKIISPTKSSVITLRLRRVTLIIIILFTIYLLAGLIFAKPAYQFKPSGKVITNIQKIVPYPAAMVGNTIISLNRVKADVALVSYFIDITKTNDRYKEINIPENLYNRAIEAAIVDQIANKYGVTVSKKEIQEAWEKILVEEDGFGDVDLILKEFHGTDEKHLKIYIRETLIREKIEEQIPKRRQVSHILITFDPNKPDSKTKALEKILQVKKHIDTGTKFVDAAKEYSEDNNSRDKGGDLGFVDIAFQLDGKDEQVFKDAIFNNKINQVSEPIETHLGYHLVMPVAEKGKVQKSMGQVIEETKATTRIIRFIKFK